MARTHLICLPLSYRSTRFKKKKKSLLPTVQDTGEDRDITVAMVYLGLWCTIVMKAENKS